MYPPEFQFAGKKKLYCLHIKKENTIKHKRREEEVNDKDVADWVLQSARANRRLWNPLASIYSY